MKIKLKILGGFILIIAMLLVAGTMSIYQFSHLSKSVQALIKENYKTIEAAKTMLEALEREDSGILLLMSGQWEKGRAILQSADSTFYTAFRVAKNNITEEDEDQYVERIEQSYLKFKKQWEYPIVGTDKENNMNWYNSEIHNNFNQSKSDIKDLMSLNQNSMYKEATQLNEQARRSIMPGIVAIVAALVFLIIFNFFISKFYVKPIEQLIESVKNHHSQTQSFNAGISSNDELKELETEIRNLIHRVNQPPEK